MPQNQENNQVIQLDDNFGVLDDILKKEPQESKPQNKIEKLLEFFNQHKKISVIWVFYTWIYFFDWFSFDA